MCQNLLCTISDVLSLTQLLFHLPQRQPALTRQALLYFTPQQPQTASLQPCLSPSSHTGASLLVPQDSLGDYVQPDVWGISKPGR